MMMTRSIRRVCIIREETASLSNEITDASMNGGEKSILQNYECWKWERRDSLPDVDAFVTRRIPREPRLPQPISGSLS